ncbi:hypothetical protein AAMO2058_000519500 [Amorphochlora amoebiformis]
MRESPREIRARQYRLTLWTIVLICGSGIIASPSKKGHGRDRAGSSGGGGGRAGGEGVKGKVITVETLRRTIKELGGKHICPNETFNIAEMQENIQRHFNGTFRGRIPLIQTMILQAVVLNSMEATSPCRKASSPLSLQTDHVINVVTTHSAFRSGLSSTSNPQKVAIEKAKRGSGYSNQPVTQGSVRIYATVTQGE